MLGTVTSPTNKLPQCFNKLTKTLPSAKTKLRNVLFSDEILPIFEDVTMTSAIAPKIETCSFV